jgi:hypothetical protein
MFTQDDKELIAYCLFALLAFSIMIYGLYLTNKRYKVEYQRGFGMGEQHMLNQMMKEREK